MPEISLRFLRSRPAQVVTGILFLQCLAFYLAPTAEYVPNPPPLSLFQANVDGWKMERETPLDPETQAFLRADDTLNRVYSGADAPISFFVAFFRSQRGGVTPHSPKICLPGSGWTPEASRTISLEVPGEAKPIPINRYIVRHGSDRELVMYWYATAHHVMADEYLSKLFLMHEGLVHRRSDEAVLRVITPVAEGATEDAAEKRAIRFIRSMYAPLKRQMWTSI